MSKQDDVLGWSTTRWDMAETEVLSLFHDTAVRLQPPVEFTNPKRLATIAILETAIAGGSCTIYFLFEKSGGLNEVIIKPIVDKPHHYFNRFFELLVQKYGQATFTNKEGITDTVSWVFPSTVIQLTRIDASVLDMLLVTISYTRTKTSNVSLL